jgi:uncharacterized protein YlxW (UPF0749 family)
MRAWIGIFALVALGLGEAPAWAQERNSDVEALRRELENVRRQFETMKDGYEKAINTLADRLKAVESRPAVATVACSGLAFIQSMSSCTEWMGSFPVSGERLADTIDSEIATPARASQNERGNDKKNVVIDLSQ